jgi:hypothetical protein
MSFLLKKNNSYSTLLYAITSSSTTLQIPSTDIGKFPTTGNFMITVWYSNQNISQSEIMLVTAVSGNTFTISRAQENTTAQVFDPSLSIVYIQMEITAGQLVEHETAITQGWDPISDTWTFNSVDGPTGVINVPSDATLKYTNGMRLRFNQSQPLTSYWPFDSNSNDQVGTNNGTATNVTYTPGKFGNAATFDGSTSNIALPSNASLQPTGAFTVGFWMKTTESGNYQRILSSWSYNPNLAGIFIMHSPTTNNLTFLIGNNTETVWNQYSYTVNGNTVINDGIFHYVVITFNQNYRQLYVDGKLDGAGYSFNPVYASTNYVRVGCYNNNGTNINFFSGQIDDLFIINGYALDGNTIAAKYAAATAQGSSALTLIKNALITAVSPTAITAYFGNDYALVNSSISNPYFSPWKAPYGFQLDPHKWMAIFEIPYDSYANVTVGTPVNISGAQLTVPIGAWKLGYAGSFYPTTNPATSSSILSFLAPSTSNVNHHLYFYTDNQTGDPTTTHVANDDVILYSKTTYYLYLNETMGNGASVNQFGSRGVYTTIKAISNYL